MSVRQSTDLQKNNALPESAEAAQARKAHERREFRKWLLLFLAVLMVLCLYFILADLSTAPRFVYSQF